MNLYLLVKVSDQLIIKLMTNPLMTGHYVPQLTYLISQSGLKFNLKGFAVGNALMEFNTDFNSEGN